MNAELQHNADISEKFTEPLEKGTFNISVSLGNPPIDTRCAAMQEMTAQQVGAF